ncbi:hypothetical protein BD626DRAFT_476098 [Schizophyllum amplum]|uniref:BSD domain-containing protein n=1 Tax=Schizophyllum amplum TaxID=97359 RepID=A0A550CZ27_9AGAR|nr:hypothetical protein BD626DRAFT_476098 [Auriculariopsis ampla]
MNFVDPFDIATASSSTPPPQTGNEQSLNEEVNQVIGQLGRFWGGFRQQSQAALEIARKDLGDVVVQAQKELTKLTTEVTSPAAPETPAFEPTQDELSSRESVDKTPVASPKAEHAPSTSAAAIATAQVQSIFNRLQAALPPTVVAAVQHNLETVQHTVQHNIENLQQTDLAQLRANLSAEVARVQGVTRAQAEEYMHRSEELLREAGDVLRDAVRVLPPEDDIAGSAMRTQPGVVWDGSDIWMLPEPASSTTKGKGRASGETQRSVATRAEALLRRLRSDPDIMMHDPEADEKVRGMYEEWLGGAKFALNGETEWDQKVESALGDEADGAALKETRDTLVPSKLTEDVFWQRYFFRVHQIEAEEAKRKTLLQAQVNDTDEEFSWGEEDEEEDVTTQSKTTAGEDIPNAGGDTPTKATKAAKLAREPSQTQTPNTMSPRGSSGDESYDVVSSNVSAAGEERKKESEESEEDSDWE